MKVEDVMARDVKTAKPEDSLKDVAGLLWQYEIGGMPVIDDRGWPLGVISKSDILIKERAEARSRWPWAVRNGAHSDDLMSKVRAHTAGEAMSAPAITIDPDAPLGLTAERMLRFGVNRLPVMSRDELVGIVTRHDLVGAFARDDEDLEREIREETLAALNWPDALELSVQDGEVELRGRVDSVRDAQTLPIQVRRIVGVVSVDAELHAWDPRGERTLSIATRV